MKRRNATRSALFTSIISLLLCVSMLVGTTFAWFTDSVTSGVNTIAAGNLDVELYHSKENDFTNPDKVDSNTLLFTDVNGMEIENWEPGVVAFTNLQVANVGSLALKYQLSVNSTEMNYVEYADGTRYTLADALKVAVIPGGVSGTREQIIAAASSWTGLESFTLSGVLEGSDKSTTYGIAIYWEPGDNTNDNLFNMNNGKTTSDGYPLSITLGVNLFATQEMYEEDSFGDDYDKDAWVDGFKVYDAADLQAAINNGENAVLMNDIDVDDTLTIPAGVTVNLNGQTLSADWLVTEGAASVVNGTVELPAENYIYSDITLEDVVITSDDLTVMAYTDGTITLKNVTFTTPSTSNPLQNYGGTLILDGVTVSQEGDANTAWYSSALQVVNEIAKNDAGKWDIISQANTTINGGTYTGKKALMISAPGGNVTINGGKFVGSEYAIQDDFAPQNYPSGANYESVITINDGFFDGALNISTATELTIYGGTFTADPSDYVADDCSVTEYNGLYYVAGANTVYVKTGGGLKNALESGKTAILLTNISMGSKTIEIPADTETTLELNGYSVTKKQPATAAAALIVNKGTLTIQDSVGTGVISYADTTEYTADNNYASNTIRNAGVLNVTGGTIENVSSDNVANYGYPHAIDAYQGSVTNISGGTVKSVNYDAIRMFCNSATQSTVVNITGGTIINRVTFQHPGTSVGAALGELNISGGNFVSTTGKANVRLLAFGTDYSNMNATITGGTFDTGVGITNYTSVTDFGDWLTVTGVDVPVFVANTDQLQAALDSATEGTTIQLAPGVAYDAVELRPTASNETTMVCTSCNYTATNAEGLKAHLNDGKWHGTPDYTTYFKNVTIIGAKGATVAGLTASAGHAYGNVYDHVLDKDYDEGSAYYCTLNISNLTFRNVAFTGKVNINTADEDSVYDGVTFTGCSFTTGGTASTNGAAIRYYNESSTNGNVRNILVDSCTFTNCYQGVYVQNVNGITITGCSFDTTGHNAIGIQGTSDLKDVVITGNTFANIADRVIRFNEVGADSNITIKNNTATNSGDEDGEVMKATSIASGVVTNISGNTWNGTVVNTELQDK